MVTVLVALGGLLALSALAIDGSYLWAARTQMQNGADSAALAAGRSLIDPAGPSVTLAAAEAAATSYGSQNKAAGTPSIVIPGSDITFGSWDLETRTFDSGVDLTDPGLVNAVDVVARLDDDTSGRIPAFMARALGTDDFAVGASATAYLGYAGGALPGHIDLPIAIDCCKLAGADCKQKYCPAIETNPPNPCDLVEPEDEGATTVTCLEFHSTPEQNACWTNFSGENPSVNTSDMTGIIEDGQEFEVSTDQPIYIDNGTKTPVIGDIEDRFLGNGYWQNNPSGSDIYEPIHVPPQSDSWVVGLPVIECQDGIGCATGDPMRVVGVVCFEIREVTVVPDKIIRGRFLCPTDELFDQCDVGLTKSGGFDFGIRADIPVLVR
jgi:hypothetical protein